MRRAAVALFGALIAAAAGCSGASTDPGVSAGLQAPGAQFVPGARPAAAGGPMVLAFNVSAYHVVPGAAAQPVNGTLDAGATAVTLGLDGDRGYWILPAGVPDTETPTEPSFHALLSFSRALAPGPITLDARAVDAAGRFGPPSTLALTVDAAAVPAGKLVFTLRWDTASDLDLHVVDPSGAEIWANHPSGSGALDLDSNAQCLIDGRDQEDVIFASSAPAGHYVARVDAFSLCGQTIADWRLEARADGVVIAEAAGTSVDADTIGPHERGSGRTALEIDLP
ncbi:MAG TPA: hypothetical protein VFF06_26905 [Polyangia bacterium]|nr:hypothetical protein [Polyangia bacterium]